MCEENSLVGLWINIWLSAGVLNRIWFELIFLDGLVFVIFCLDNKVYIGGVGLMLGKMEVYIYLLG